MDKPRERVFNESEIAALWNDAYAQGWRACWNALSATMQEKSAPYLPSGPAPEIHSTQWYALEAVNQQHGMTTLEAIARTQQIGCIAPEGSIRVALGRLKTKRLIVARENNWFPA